MMTLHTFFCGDEITQNLIDHVSLSYYCRDILLWANHEAGAIVPLHNDDRLYFVSYSYTPGDIYNLMKNHKDGNEENTCPMVAEGILGQWLRLKPEDWFQKEYRPSRKEQEELDGLDFEKPMTPQQIFEDYFNICKQRYIDAHQYEMDAWRKDLDKEFATKVHLSDERLKAEKSKAIFPYFREADIDKLKDVLDNYLMFVQSKTKTLYPESEEELRTIAQQHQNYLEKRTEQKVEKTATKLKHKLEKNPDMPQPLVNTIFAERIKVKEGERDVYYDIDYEKVWNWINDNFVYNLKNQHEWTALWLFAREHKLLKEPEIMNTKFADAISTWFPKAKKKCTADALGTYRNGYFSTPNFNYRAWVASENSRPAFKTKDQSYKGFDRIYKICKTYLEVEFEAKYITKD